MEKLISELESLKLSSAGFRAGSYNEGINAALHLIKSSLPTQQDKVVVPGFVARYIAWCKSKNWELTAIATTSNAQHYESRLGPSGLNDWIVSNYATFLIAIATDDYTVEKKPLYYVQLPFNEGNHIKTYYLRKGKLSGDTWFGSSNAEYSGNTARLTEQEIKDHDERYWAFAVLVEEEVE